MREGVVRAQFPLRKRARPSRQLGGGLGETRAGGHPDDVVVEGPFVGAVHPARWLDVVRASVAHPRNPEFRRSGSVRPEKGGWRDADDGEGHAVHQDGASDGGVGCTKKCSRKSLVQHHHRIAARRRVFLGAERSSGDHAHAEHVEVVGGDRRAEGETRRDTVQRQAIRDRCLPRDPDDSCRAVPDFREVGVRDVVRNEPVAHRRAECVVEQAVLTCDDRQRSEEERVRHADHRRGRAQTDREGDDDGGGQHRALAQVPHGIPNVVPEASEQTASRGGFETGEARPPRRFGRRKQATEDVVPFELSPRAPLGFGGRLA